MTTYQQYIASGDIVVQGTASGRRLLVCPNSACQAEQWSVAADSRQRDLWSVESDEFGAWTIAADEPLCPRCAATLGVAYAHAADAGPFVAFIDAIGREQKKV
jgi:hypothetical protein